MRGRPDSSSRSGMPISGRKRPPRSKMRRMLPGCVISKRGNGSRNGRTPFFVISSSRRRRHGLQPLRHAVHAVALAVAGLLVRHRAVVVEGGAPEHAAVRHHARACCPALPSDGSRVAAAEVRDAQVARIDEADELGRFVIEQRVGAHRDCRAEGQALGKARLDVGRVPCSWRWRCRRGNRCSRGGTCL